MKVKFLRDYHGPETNEYRYLEGVIVDLYTSDAESLIGRKIVISIEPVEEVIEEVAEIEAIEPVIEVVKPVKIVTKPKKK